MAVIDSLKLNDGTILYQKTLTSAIYNEAVTERLDNALANRPEKPSFLPAKTTLADTDLVTVEGTGGVVNKMTVGKLKELLGIQSGGIVESGSDANGSYVKYADGLMVFQSKISVDTTSTGNKIFYTSQNFLADTPKSVLYSPSSLAAITTRNNYKKILGVFMADSRQNSYNFYVDAVGDGLVAMNVTIIGRWK